MGWEGLREGEVLPTPPQRVRVADADASHTGIDLNKKSFYHPGGSLHHIGGVPAWTPGSAATRCWPRLRRELYKHRRNPEFLHLNLFSWRRIVILRLDAGRRTAQKSSSKCQFVCCG